MVVEECSELIQALVQHRRGRKSVEEILEEAADVEIMIEQLKQIIGDNELFEEVKGNKLKRLKRMVEEGQP